MVRTAKVAPRVRFVQGGREAGTHYFPPGMREKIAKEARKENISSNEWLIRRIEDALGENR